MPLNRATGIDASTSLSTFGYPNPTSATGGSLDLSGLLASIRSNFTITGGGTIFFSSSSYLSWSQRFIVMQAGSRNTNFAVSGYFDINMPSAGTVVIGLGGSPDRVVDATGIQINTWESLYYVLPINSSNVSIGTNFRIVGYTANYDIPAHWVRIATRNGDSPFYLYLNNGIVLGVGEYSSAGFQTLTATAHSIVKRDGSGNAWSSGIAQHDGTNTLVPVSAIKSSGGRAANLNPNTYQYGLFSEFKNTSFAGVTSGSYGGLLTYAVWDGTTVSTGDPSYQLLFHPAGINSTLPPVLKIRAGIDTTWGSFSTILHSSNASSFVIAQGGDLSAAADWNTYTTPGIYRYGRADWTGVTNNPAASAYTFGTLSVLGTGTNGITQVYYSHNATSGIYYRTKWNASDWTAWVQSLDNSSATNTKSGSIIAASFIPSSSTVPTNGMYLSAANTLNFATNTTNRMSIDSSGAIIIPGALTVTGDLTINGTTTNINTTNLVVEDKNIILGDVSSPSTTTADGGGITLLAGGSNKTFNWINATDRWTSSVGLEATSFTTTGAVNINTVGLGQINLGDGNIQKQSGSGFVFNSSGSFSQGLIVTTANGLALNYASPAITSSNASAASIFTSNVTGITIGSSTIKTTDYPVAPTGTTSGTVTQAAQLSGYIGMPQNAQATSGTFAYTFAASDAGKHIYATGTPSSVTFTIPANSAVAFEIGTTFVVMNDLGAATNISIAITTDTLQLAGTGTTGTRTLARYGVASITKVTSTKWIISGNGLT